MKKHLTRRHFGSGAKLALAMMVMALIAAGTATAARLITSAKIKNGTIQLRDVSKKARTALKGRTGPRGLQGPQGAQGSQGPIGPSKGFIARQAAATPTPAGTDTVVVQLFLPPGRNYIVTAATELGNTSGAANLVNCTLVQNDSPFGAGSTNLPASNVFAQTITLTGATTGGNIKLSCNPGAGAQGRNRVITAIEVGALAP